MANESSHYSLPLFVLRIKQRKIDKKVQFHSLKSLPEGNKSKIGMFVMTVCFGDKNEKDSITIYLFSIYFHICINGKKKTFIISRGFAVRISGSCIFPRLFTRCLFTHAYSRAPSFNVVLTGYSYSWGNLCNEDGRC